MKKILILILLSLSLVGCTKDEVKPEPDKDNTEDVVTSYMVNVIVKEQTYSYDIEENNKLSINTINSLITNEDKSNFLYWYYLDNDTEVRVTEDLTITKNIVISAKFSQAVTSYNVTIKNNGSETVVQVKPNEKFSFSILENLTTNPKFLYWYYLENNQEVKVEGDIIITKNITIIAKYDTEITSFDVTIKHKSTEKVVTVNVGESLEFTILNDITKEDKFLYWYYLENNQEVKVEGNISITKDITIIAKYEGSTGTLPWV